jgi:tripartite ATP-independent transporter DctM subunit
MIEYLPIILFATIFLLILFGFPVAFTLGGISVIIGLWVFDVNFFYLLSLRVYGTMQNFVLLAVPLFVFMGMMLERSGISEKLLETMAMLFGRFKGGLAISVILVGAMLAASTGIVGATVVTMGLISLPTMLKRGYSPVLSVGVITASGTLGQIIPPSVVLVLLGSVLNVSVGDLFTAAIVPGVGLILCYLVYTIIFALIFPKDAPAIPKEERDAFRAKGFSMDLVKSFLFPLALIMAVLGSIFAGIASPTEAAGVGAFGAIILTLVNGKLNYQILKKVSRETTLITSMVFMILVGATAFSLVFRGLEGDKMFLDMIKTANLSPYAFLFMVMLVVFIAGFFIDFIEIIFIIVPVVAPIFVAMGIDLVWVGILLAINLQTSFLTPPFGFALFYLKGVAPPELKTSHLYLGVIPFVIIQLIFLITLVIFPGIVSFLPELLK